MSLGSGNTSALEQVNHRPGFKRNVAYHIHRFRNAIENSDEEVIDTYLQKQYSGYNPDDNEFIHAAFSKAVELGHNKAIKALAVFCPEKRGDTLIKMTQSSNHDGVDFFRSLCKLDKDKFDIERAFEAAIESGPCDIFKLLHESYRVLFENPKYTKVLYRRAASYKRYDICEFILRHHFEQVEPHDINDSFLAAAAFGVTNFIRYIVENHVDTITPEKRVEALEQTALHEDLIAYQLILQRCGPELNIPSLGFVLWRLSKNGALTAIQLLMAYATPEKLQKMSDRIGEALHEATFHQKEDVALYLMAQYGEYLSDKSKAGVFHTAAIVGCTQVVKVSHEKWRHLITSEQIDFAINHATSDQPEIMSFLLEKHIKEIGDQTLVFIFRNAAFRGNTDRIRFLLEHCLHRLHPKDIEEAAGHAKAEHPDLAQLIVSATPRVLTFRKQETGQQKLVSNPAATEATTKKKKKHPAKQ